MRVRLSEVARRAGVSEPTASRVLNGKAGVSLTTREAVFNAAEELGYTRAREVPTRGRLIGLIVPELTNPVFPVMVQVLENALVRQGFTPLLCTLSPGGLREDDYIDLALEHRVAGIVFVSGMHADTKADTKRYAELLARRLPIVFVNGYVESLAATFISCDDAAAAELAVKHLADLGHERIGLANGPERYTPVIRRRAGFLRAMRQHLGAREKSVPVINTDFSFQGGGAAATILMDQGVTGIVCGSDVMALGAIRTIRSHGKKVPEDVSVIGYDDSPLMAFTDPPLSTIRQPVSSMAIAAVRALLDEILQLQAPRHELVFEPELLARLSTGPARKVSAHRRSAS
ncbi:MAG: LacI family DNA-binding transcriptional regulator [Acidimicrobiaceae bacterium]|nr:LacI family DNA-binding transcriptional regulator [Acidimicrobiaceae bacterium]